MDLDAAGHGWFIDTTPDSNDEYLPTADPNIWKAKAGSEAEGKMDMLSVLLHEYGHAIGLEHSADPRDFMAASLQPGERRLPTANQLALMSQLVAELRSADGSQDPGHPHDPHDDPFLPTSQRSPSGQRLARRSPGSSGQGNGTDYQGAVNSTLTNGDFGAEGSQAWVAEGDVQVQGDAITLTESTTRHTHLAQGFVINPGDRLLSFTLSGQALAANTAGPGDAFEAALLDANTGLPVAGTVDLTRSDALLNLQTDGSEHLAAGVRKIVNADGSATYYVSLAEALVNTPVLLSFDLLGFGAAQSSITLRDVKLIANPIAGDDAAATDEDTALTGTLLANDVLAGAAIAQVQLVTDPSHGTLTLADDGSFSYQPDADYFGPDSFSYRFTDADGRSSNTATVQLSVRPVNDAPVLAAAEPVTLMAGKPYTFNPLAGASDVEGSALSVQWLSQPQHGVLVVNADGSYTYTADIEYGGDDSLSWRVSDGDLFSAPVSIAFTVEPANTAPVANDSVLALAEDGSLIITPASLGLDAEGDALTCRITAQPAHGTLTVQPDGTWLYTPDADFNGSDTLRFTLSDGVLVSNEATLSIQVTPVNDAPTLADQSATLQEDGSLTLDPLASAVDIDADALTATVVAGPAHGTLAVNPDGSFTYTAAADYFGTDSFTYRVNDGQAESNLATVALEVTPVNDAPVAQDGSATLAEDGTLLIDLRTLGFDVDSSTLDTLIVTAPAHGTLTRNDDGSYTYVPQANYHGPDAIRFVLQDESLQSNEATLSIEVTPVNDAPTLADQSASLQEDGSLTLNPLAGAVDIDADPLTATVVAGPAHGTLTINPDGSFTYTSAADYFGADSFTYRVTDGQAESNLATVTLEVTPVNDAPVAQDGSATLAEDGTLLIDLRTLGFDVDSIALDTLIVTAPAHGTLTRNDDGSYTYVPTPDFHGTDTIRFRLRDDELESNEGTLAILVTPVNDVPTLADRSVHMEEDGTLSLDLLSSATDIDGDALTVSVLTAPAHGTLTVNPDGSFTYAAAANYFGTDSFSYQVSDGQATSNLATVSLSIAAVNDAPTAVDTLAIGVEDQALLLQWSDFAVEDVDASVDGNPLRVRITSLPAEGVLQRLLPEGEGDWLDVVMGDEFTQADIEAGHLRFVPDANASGGTGHVHSGYGNRHEHYARFGYIADDGTLQSAEAVVTLDITALADAPTLVFTGANSSTRELFRAGWEAAPNIDSQSTLVQQDLFDGWTLVTSPESRPGGRDGFEIWANGDRMTDAGNNLRHVNAMAGNGSQWLELNDAGGEQHQTLGIQRSVQTLAGASYTLSFDVAGRLGFRSGYTGIAVYVDGVKLAEASPTSPSSSLDWRTLSYTFTGSGGLQNVRIVTEASQTHAGGRGTMLDDIALTETTPLNHGAEDTLIPLQGLTAALADTDGSEALVLTLTGLPLGATLSDGVNSFTASESALVANLSGWNTAALVLQPPADFSGTLSLQVQATAIETATGGRATVTRQLDVQVSAVADAPTLTLTARDLSVTRELLSTSWEGVANRHSGATLVSGGHSGTLEGWSVVEAAHGRHSRFEVWASGDRMRNSAGDLVTVQAAAGDGSNWLRLHDGAGQGHQTLGIERSVDTVEGAIYTLSFDYAGGLGVLAANTRVGLYVDDQLVASYADTSSLSALNWQALSFQFTGNGRERSVRIQLEGGSGCTGRSAMLDDIRIVETLPSGDREVYGLSDTAIALPRIAASLADTDGSETLAVALLGLPAGATVSDGTRSVTLAQAGSLDLSGWDLGRLSLRPPACFTGTLQLSVLATATESSNGSSASTSQPLTVHVFSGTAAATPVGVNPYITLANGSTGAGTAAPSEQIIVTGLPVSESGAVLFTLTAGATVRSWEEEEALEVQRAQSLGDEWLHELEQQANAQWARWMEPGQ